MSKRAHGFFYYLFKMNNPKKDWCFTHNVDDEAEAVAVIRHLTDTVKNTEAGRELEYMRFQVERGGETEHLHLQGFLIAKKRLRFQQLNKLLGLTIDHWEGRKGSRSEADKYCRKSETRVLALETSNIDTEFTWGEIPKRASASRAKKDDILEELRVDIDSNGELPSLNKIPASILFSAAIDKMGAYIGNGVSYLEAKKNMHKALVLHGKSGVGKSYSAVKVAEKIFGVDGVLKITVTDAGRLWFPSITVKPRATCLIIDEFHWNRISPDLFKAILSGDATMLDVKCGYRPNLFKQVIITTNDDPKRWGWPWQKNPETGKNEPVNCDVDDPALSVFDNYQAVQRRFDALDCTNVDWLGEEGGWASIELWLEDKLSWAMPKEEAEKVEEEKRIGEGACAQRLGSLEGWEEEEEEPAVKTPRLDNDEDAGPADGQDDGRLRRLNATEGLEEEEESRMTDGEDDDDAPG